MTFVTARTNGAMGELVLSSPKTLNALTHADIKALQAGIAEHEANPAVRAMVLRSDSDKAFCAGGDMKQIREYILAGQYDAINAFFVDEYALNQAISQCRKPYIALMNGIVMGGGMGISIHGSLRIVSEKSLLAMPESRIGFFPDVGASYFLPRLPKRAGYWLGLTAASVQGHEAVQLGLATHCVRSERFDELREALAVALNALDSQETKAAHDSVLHVLASFSEPVQDKGFMQTLDERKIWFADDNLEAIEQRLRRAASTGNSDAQHLLTLYEAGSPYSYDITLKLFADAQGKNLQQCLELELALGSEAVRFPDCAEGVRAVLVDKDRNPVWSNS